MSQPLTVECPTCGTSVEWKSNNKYRPFCSDHYKLISLGAWAAEEHAIPDDTLGDDIFSADLLPRKH